MLFVHGLSGQGSTLGKRSALSLRSSVTSKVLSAVLPPSSATLKALLLLHHCRPSMSQVRLSSCLHVVLQSHDMKLLLRLGSAVHVCTQDCLWRSHKCTDSCLPMQALHQQCGSPMLYEFGELQLPHLTFLGMPWGIWWHICSANDPLVDERSHHPPPQYAKLPINSAIAS